MLEELIAKGCALSQEQGQVALQAGNSILYFENGNLVAIDDDNDQLVILDSKYTLVREGTPDA